MNIEENFKPDTFNELLLYKRIMELKNRMFKKGIMDFKSMGDQEIDVNMLCPTLTLDMLNVVDVDRDDPFHMKVIARSYGEDSFGFATYVTDTELYNTNDKMQLLLEIHKRAMFDLAKMYERKSYDG